MTATGNEAPIRSAAIGEEVFCRDARRERRALIVIGATCVAAYIGMAIVGPMFLAHPLIAIGPAGFFFVGWLVIRRVHGPEMSVTIDWSEMSVRVAGHHLLYRAAWTSGERRLTVVRFDQIEAVSEGGDNWASWTEIETSLGMIRIASAVQPHERLRESLLSIVDNQERWHRNGTHC